MGLLIWIFVCGIAGWLAGWVMKSKRFGTPRDPIIGFFGGILGGILGGWLPRLAGLWSGLIPYFIVSFIMSCVGAVILVLISRRIKKNPPARPLEFARIVDTGADAGPCRRPASLRSSGKICALRMGQPQASRMVGETMHVTL